MKNLILFIFYFFSLSCISQNENLYEQAKKLIEQKHLDSASIYLNHYRKTLISSNHEAYAKHNYMYAKVLKNISKTDSSFYYLKQAEQFYSNKDNYKEELLSVLTLKAEIFRYYGKRYNALRTIYDAEKLYREDFDVNIKAYFLNRRSALLAYYYNNVEDSVIKIKKLTNKILRFKDEITDKSILAYSLNELGYLEFNKSRTKALRYYNEAYNIALLYNETVALIDISLNLGRLYQQKYLDYDKAIYYHKIALKYAKMNNNFWQAKEAVWNLRICYDFKQDYKTAMHFSDSITHYFVKIFTQENATIIEELKQKHNLELKDSELKKKETSLVYLGILLLVLISGIIMMVFFNTKIRRKNKVLAKLVDENHFLVKETNHRINNNLQLVTALLFDFKRKSESEKVKKSITELQAKIDSVSLLHRHLYNSKNKKMINQNDYINAIFDSFKLEFKEKNIQVNYNVSEVELDSDIILHFGLLITELLLNSIKHAFKNQKMRKIDFELIKSENNLSFKYNDNGENNLKEIQPKLVEQICLHLEVSYNIYTTNGFSLSFKKEIKG